MHPNKQNFVEGLSIIFKRWTALQLAVEMEWGGIDTAAKAQDLEDSLVDYFEKEGKTLEPEDLEDILLDVMKEEFGCVLEDGSEVEVARQMLALFKESIKGDTTILNQLKRKPNSDRSALTLSTDASPEGSNEMEDDVAFGDECYSDDNEIDDF